MNRLNGPKTATLSIIIPAFKEVKNIRGAVENIIAAIAENSERISDFEIIIIVSKDYAGKDDGTGEIAEKIAATDPHIQAIIYNGYMDLGDKFWRGVALAKMRYITFFPGDNETTYRTIRNVIGMTGDADTVIAYTANMEVRPFFRRLLSYTYTFTLNTLFGLKVKYFSGTCLFKTELLRSLPESTKANRSLTYMAEILIRLLKHGHNYKEVEMFVQHRHGKSKVLTLHNLLDVCRSVAMLFIKVRILKQN